MVSRRWVIAGLLAGAAMPAWAEAPVTSPRPPPRGMARRAARASAPASGEALVAAAKLAGAVGYLAVDAATGAVIDSREPETPLPPASTTKVDHDALRAGPAGAAAIASRHG